jgi:DNA-binding CsgD family transcriptional regulator
MRMAAENQAMSGHEGSAEQLAQWFSTDPGVGISIVDRRYIVTYTNARAAQIFLQASPGAAIGKTLEELFGEPWTAERVALFEQVLHTGRPALSRHIRHGRRVQSSIRLLGEQDDPTPRFLVITIEGEHDPVDPESYDIVESNLVHLGPLGTLTRREIEVLALIGYGMTTPEIAQTLHRSPRTVERHCDAIRAKLSASTRLQVAEFARRAGLKVEHSRMRRI